MTKHTSRDMVWDQALQFAMAEESFKLGRIRDALSESPSDRTIRDTLNTMVDQGWLSKETERGHEWRPGVRVLGEEVDEDSQDASVNDLDGVQTPSDLMEDVIYTAEVDRFAGENAMIGLERGELNLGPIDQSAEGEKVEFEYQGGVWGRCLTEEYTYESYNPRDGISKSKKSKKYRKSIRFEDSSSESNVAPSDPDNKNKLLKGDM